MTIEPEVKFRGHNQSILDPGLVEEELDDRVGVARIGELDSHVEDGALERG